MTRTGRPPKNPKKLTDFGKRVTELMTEQNITGSELAKKLDIGKANVSRYKNGKRIPNGKQLIDLARALNTTAEKLID